jgi:hypothetical protein
MGPLRRGSMQSAPDTEPEPDKVLEIAYNAAIKALEQQDFTLGNLRNRAAGLLSAVTIATTFAAGLGLFSADPTKGTPLSTWSKWVLLGLLVATGAVSIAVMWPVEEFSFGPYAGAILNLHKKETGVDGVRRVVIGELQRRAVRTR